MGQQKERTGDRQQHVKRRQQLDRHRAAAALGRPAKRSGDGDLAASLAPALRSRRLRFC